jgi:hypothetical protein
MLVEQYSPTDIKVNEPHSASLSKLIVPNSATDNMVIGNHSAILRTVIE